ncbi:ATP-binding protein [Dactylosporangium vinaceum]|uniref:ATP-binding protein n=1 Tax=Dactylosporangium vinaceum TaxID=53362 RepID=A0ABV5MP90_9ACTN|nr:DUF87 domain-containing protein [Dactylosporangium vinaceum]UAB94520.1 ATP-binding protein [Dactylosporangium vinaceum]
MIKEQRAALAALRLSWAPVPDDVWRRSPLHVDGLYEDVLEDLMAGVEDAAASPGPSPISLAMLGRGGSGKTHMLGWLRERVQERGGYFFLVSLLDEKSFWPSVLAYMRESLARPVLGGDITQLHLLLRRLTSRIGAPRTARRAVMGETELTRPALDAFIEGLLASDEFEANLSRDTARALALSVSTRSEHRDIADSYFDSDEESVAGERSSWGIRRRPHTAEDIVHELSMLLALTGPAVIAVDQIDTLVAQAELSADLELNTDSQANRAQATALESVAGGLLRLRERTRRTLTVVACLPSTWTLIAQRATTTMDDRFRGTPVLKGVIDARLAQEIVERRFAVRYAALKFTPPYPTWPVRPTAFSAVGLYTPRQLLKEIDSHVRDCLRSGELRELTHLNTVQDVDEPTISVPVTPEAPDEVHERIEARFEQLRRDAEVTAALEGATEDSVFPELLAAGLTAWILERGEGAEVFTLDPPPSANPDLHARLRRTLDEGTEDQVHWCFRAVSDTHQALAALNRFRRARRAAGLSAEVPKRKLVLIRNGPWSSGAKTQAEIKEFQRAGGLTLAIDDADLRTLWALRELQDESPTELQAWLVKRQPTAEVALFRRALADAGTWSEAEARARMALREAEPVAAEIVVGYDHEGGQPVRVPLEALRKHVAIFAGSGSGKTVLIRRLVEECALHGVSAIVLDPNNDLARLGDPWPEAPESWGSGDRERAAEYLAETEVVVWTPRREAGRPLSFQPLPDFAAVRADPDEFAEAVEAAVAALAPRAGLGGRTTKAHLGLAVLRKATEHFARSGGQGLPALIGLLAELPDGVSGLADADKIAAGLAQSLTAAMDNDPMFGGSGAPADPGVLLTPAPGKRARISVISLIGLPSEDARQGFVNQLQMALFAWIKKHPARNRPLLGLFVMDEAQTLAPSGAMTACTQSTLALAAQARKYGLGLLFATQAPKGLHNRISGNATTQFYGLLNAQVQIDAARELARVKGGDVPEVGGLRAGEFYVAVEGEPPQRVRAPLCLSHHPSAPLTTEEVVERAGWGGSV